jgi:hypothetical protein
MAQKDYVDDWDRAPEQKFYLPAGVLPPFDASRLERLWGKLFNHGIEPPK